MFRPSGNGNAGRQWRAFHLIVLAGGLLAVALASIDGLPSDAYRLLTVIVEVVSLVFFGEYLARLWTAPESARYAGLSDSAARLRWGSTNLMFLASCSGWVLIKSMSLLHAKPFIDAVSAKT